MGALTHLPFPNHPHHRPTYSSLVDSMCNITGTEKTLKTSRIEIVCRISYEMIATYITALFTGMTTREPIILYEYFSNYEMCVNGRFSKI